MKRSRSQAIDLAEDSRKKYGLVELVAKSKEDTLHWMKHLLKMISETFGMSKEKVLQIRGIPYLLCGVEKA